MVSGGGAGGVPRPGAWTRPTVLALREPDRYIRCVDPRPTSASTNITGPEIKVVPAPAALPNFVIAVRERQGPTRLDPRSLAIAC
jgi:hypothetical protein